MQMFSKSISLLLVFLGPFCCVLGQNLLPQHEGDKERYSVCIEMPKGYVSGIGMLKCEDGTVKGSLFNEFGLSFIDFSYQLERDKVRIHKVMKRFDKWALKRMLKKDLQLLLHGLTTGETTYYNSRYQVKYTLAPMPDEKTKTDNEIIE